MFTNRYAASLSRSAALIGIIALAGATAPAVAQNKAANKISPIKTTEFPDGTGTISLPAGWRISGAYRGSVGCKGPAETKVVLGMLYTILRSDSPVVSMPELNAMGPVPMAQFGDLKTALRESLKAGNARLTSLRSQPAPSGIPGIPAVNFIYEFTENGKTMMGVGYFSAIGDPNDTSMGTWRLYASAMLAPKERFIRELPAMMAIWKSWRPNGQKPKAGSESALMDAMAEATKKANNDLNMATQKANMKRSQESLKLQQETFDRMNEKFRREVILQ